MKIKMLVALIMMLATAVSASADDSIEQVADPLMDKISAYVRVLQESGPADGSKVAFCGEETQREIRAAAAQALDTLLDIWLPFAMSLRMGADSKYPGDDIHYLIANGLIPSIEPYEGLRVRRCKALDDANQVRDSAKIIQARKEIQDLIRILITRADKAAAQVHPYVRQLQQAKAAE